MFQLTFLGTASGIPTRERNTSAIAVECVASTHSKRHSWLLVDCGEGTQHQILKSHLNISDLSAILITHMHGDHCYGLAGLLASLGMHKRTKPLTLIAPKAMIKLLDTITLTTDLHFNYPIDFIAIEDKLNELFKIEFSENHQLTIGFCELSHRIASFGFELVQTLQKDKLLTEQLSKDGIENIYWSKILKSDETLTINNKAVNPNTYKIHISHQLKLVIAGDNDTPALLTNAIKDCRALVHEATYTDDIMQKIINKPAELGGFNPKHCSAKQVAQFAQNQHIPTLILTHFSARYAPFDDKTAKQPNMGHIRQEVEDYYQGELILAEDFLKVMIE